MFYPGDLQSGIGLAIQSAKSVACFVTDGSEESSTWEETWLADDEIRRIVEKSAVLLKLQAGSQEAGFLAAFCPLKEVPALVIIHNGQLKDHIASPVEQEEFTSRIKAALGQKTTTSTNDAAASSDSNTSVVTSEEASNPTSSESSSNLPPQNSTPSTSSPSTRTPQQILAEYQAREARERQQRQHERTARLQKEQKEQKAHSQSKGKQREDAAEQQRLEATRKAQSVAAQEARKRKKDQETELARIKARIEADKQARRNEAEVRRREREAASNGETSARSAQFESTSRSAVLPKADSKVNLQIRLFDGSTMRSTFPSSSTLLSTIRPWIDSQTTTSSSTSSTNPSPSNTPYTFRHILSPQPSRELSASDESKPLSDIELYPSATLVLVPVAGRASEAYEGGQGEGVLGTVQKGVYGAFGLLGGVLGAVGRVAGFGGDGVQESEAQDRARTVGESERGASGGGDGAGAGGVSGTGAATIKVRTLADQRREARKDDTELYNGNQLNFEPRDDDK